jgi:hypothetical protein
MTFKFAIGDYVKYQSSIKGIEGIGKIIMRKEEPPCFEVGYYYTIEAPTQR